MFLGLIDRFEEFKMNPRSAKTSSEVKSLFTRILEWIKNLFLSYSPNELDILFDNWKPQPRFHLIKVDDSTVLDNHNPNPISTTDEFKKEIAAI